MTVIRVSERGQQEDGSFAAQVAFDEDAEYDVLVKDPAAPGTEDLLTWYFEQHLRFPFLDLDKEREAVRQLARYGQDLFGQVLGGEASHDYRTLREQAFDGCRLEITGSAAFHRLHWEALRDPKIEAPLSVRLPVTRRVGQLESKFQLPPDRATLNILVVTARPFGKGDVGYRTISRPLLDAMRQSKLPVTIDLVRPGTWEALREHLRSVTEQQQSGWYQVIHFDLHGGFSEFADLDAMRQQGSLLFQTAEPFEGSRPFLFFETTHEGKAAPVPAQAVASLLEEHRIPVAVLNACQSAMQVGSEASLALQLVQAGVPAAVGMAYSVTVSAAVQVMPVLYGRLTQGADPVAALHAGRRSLYDKRGRQAYFDQQLDLEDWVLPVAFRQRALQLRLAPMDDAEQARFFQRQADVGEEPSTEYGFVGRDLDIQAIERRLLTNPDTNQVLVQGMAGAGKSTLLRHLAWWWQRTSLVDEIFVFSYEDRAWTAGQIIRAIRARLLTKVEQARADTMPEPAQLEQIAQLLRADRHLLILDNAESITATPAAIPHAISEAEQAKIKTLLSRLRGGKTLVLIGSREAEAWLAPDSFGSNIYPLPGLDPQASSTLVERILRRHDATGWLADTAERAALQDLVGLLGGYPLPMTVVLPVLATTAPSAVLADLQTGGTSPDPAGQITQAIEYSHGKLDPMLQASLLLLAPFTAAIPAMTLDYYRDLLQQDDAVQAMGPVDLAEAVAEAVRIGLARPHPQIKNMVQVQPVLPYFLRSRLRHQDHLQAVTSQAHYQLHIALSDALSELLTSGDAEERATGQSATGAEYANLTAALAHGLTTGQPIEAVIRPLYHYLDQTKQQTALRGLLEDTIARCRQPTSDTQKRELAVLHNLAGNAAMYQRRPGDARTHHETELQLLEAIGERKALGATYHQLGWVAQDQRRFEEAEANYRKSLDLKLEFGDRYSAALTYHQLGMVAQEQRRFEEAEANYRKALDLKLEFGDRYSAASTYHQLGIAAQEQQRFEEAEANYRKSLDLKLEFGDRHFAASTYHQLGIAAQAQQRFEEAQANYRKALDLKLEFGDRHSAASTYHQLGMVAQEQQRFEEAQANYRKALDLKLEFGDRYSAALTYHQLGVAAQAQRRFEEAQANYRKALDLKLEFGDRYSAAFTYHQLGMVAQAQRRFEEAQANYRKALDLKLEFGDRYSAAFTYHQLGMVAQAQRRFEEAQANYRKALDLYLEFGDRHSAASTYHQLGMVGQAQRRFKEAEAAYREALDTYLDTDKQGASRTAAKLGEILAELGRHPEAAVVALDAAVSWYQLTGNWDRGDLQRLTDERQVLGGEAFAPLVSANVPQDLQEALMAAIDNLSEL